METGILQDFLFKQLPVIVVLGVLCYFMYKYFTGVIDEMQEKFSSDIEKKDKQIKDKDEEIRELNRKLYEVTFKSNEIMGSLRELIQKMLAAK